MGEILDLWQERAAIMEFQAGFNRFEAETRAAECYGTSRHQMMKEQQDADRRGFASGHGHQARSLGGQRNASAMPRVQPRSKEENGSLSVGKPEAGRDRSALLALQLGSGEAV